MIGCCNYFLAIAAMADFICMPPGASLLAYMAVNAIVLIDVGV